MLSIFVVSIFLVSSLAALSATGIKTAIIKEGLSKEITNQDSEDRYTAVGQAEIVVSSEHPSIWVNLIAPDA